MTQSGGSYFAATGLVGITCKPEAMSSYEVWAKTQWLDRRLRLNFIDLYDNCTNLQVKSLIGSGNAQIAKTTAATIKGVECESAAQVTAQWQLTAELSYIDAKHDRIVEATVPSGSLPFLLTEPRYTVPKLSLSDAAQYTPVISVCLVLGWAKYYWQNRIYYSPSSVRNPSLAPYGLRNLAKACTPSGSPWSAEIGTKNSLEEGYFTTLEAKRFVALKLAEPPRTAMPQITGKF